jgi:ferredoxin/flavodoxin---NADP+ reductase
MTTALMHTNSSVITDNSKFTAETLTWLKPWTPKLFSFRITRPKGYRFDAGQWARLGVVKSGETKPVWRAYSIASATYEPYLEFYSIVVPNGEFTSELSHLEVGDTVLLEKMPYGFLTTSRFEQLPQQDLWLLSTGTGLAPFLSILHEFDVWQQYERIILVHGVRERAELTYTNLLNDLSQHELFKEYAEKLIYQPCLTREPIDCLPTGGLFGRIPSLITEKTLETTVNRPFSPAHSRVMICGNPDMVTDTRSVLKQLGLTVSRSKELGNIAVENYW